MEGTLQDRPCTFDDYYWGGMPAAMGEAFMGAWAGAADGVGFNVPMLMDDSSYNKYSHTSAYWVGDAVGVACAALTLGVAGVGSWGSRSTATTGAGTGLLSPSSLADKVANAAGGIVKSNKGGYTVTIPLGSRGITVRIMERGGGRSNYYRISVPGKATYTVSGDASTDAALTHIDIAETSLNDILTIIARIQGGD